MSELHLEECVREPGEMIHTDERKGPLLVRASRYQCYSHWMEEELNFREGHLPKVINESVNLGRLPLEPTCSITVSYQSADRQNPQLDPVSKEKEAFVMNKRTMNKPQPLQGWLCERRAWGEEKENLISFLKQFMTQLERHGWKALADRNG